MGFNKIGTRQFNQFDIISLCKLLVTRMGASLLINPGELRLANDIAHNLKWVLLSLKKDRGGKKDM